MFHVTNEISQTLTLGIQHYVLYFTYLQIAMNATKLAALSSVVIVVIIENRNDSSHHESNETKSRHNDDAFVFSKHVCVFLSVLSR